MDFATSADGTPIAYDVRGSGPALVLVDGALCSRAFGPSAELADELAASFTVYNYDRRGRGDSGNTQPYSPEREVEDLNAVIAAAGGSAVVAGTSSGGGLALRAAAAGSKITKLAVYETPYMVGTARDFPKNMRATLDGFIAEGKPADAVKYFLVTMVGAPAIMPVFMRLMPKVWKPMLAVAPTLPYDARVMGDDFVPDTAAFATIDVPSLVMRGSKSEQWMTDGVELIAKTLPHSNYRVLAGQTHQVKAKVIAPELVRFFAS